MPPHYEVIQTEGEWCLRIRSTGRPVAWSKTNDALFKAYCEEQEREAPAYFED